jgi:hypothetical protein
VALRDEGSDEDAVEADDRDAVTPPTEAHQLDDHDDVAESAEANVEAAGGTGPRDEAGPRDQAPVAGFGSGQETGADDKAGTADTSEPRETISAAVTEALPTAERVAAAEPVAAAGASAAAEPVISAPAEPVASAPGWSFASAAAEPAVSTPAEPGASAPAEPTDSAPAWPGASAPAEPTDSAPAWPGASAPAEPSASAEDPAPTLVDMVPGSLAGAGAARAGSTAAGGSPAAGGGAGSGNWIRSITGGAGRPSWKIATGAGAAALVAVVLVIVVAGQSAVASHKTHHKKKIEPVRVLSVSPGNGSTGVNGASPIIVMYSGPVTKHTPLPTLSPSIAGSWQVSGDKATFTPQVGFTENTHVTVNIPAPTETATTAATSSSFTTGQYSILRLDQLLSQLGYIPVAWTPANSSGDIPATDAGAQLAAAYDPPAGTFTFDSGYPAALTSQWSVGTNNEIIDGAVRTFEFDHGLTMDGDAGPHVWRHLLNAIAKGEQNPHGYTYVWVTQAGNEHLILYHNGQVAITSPVNTGIPASPTVDGTYPVYLRYTVTQMIGTNPDGSPYDDTVYWVSYFNGGDAVHAFPRAGYGWYQSLGCVELPTYGSTAEDVWNLITYGTLVTVTGPVA